MRNLRQHFSEEFESFKGLNKEAKTGAAMLIGGIVLQAAGLIESGFDQYIDYTKTSEPSKWGSSLVIFGFVIAGHGHNRQKRNKEKLDIIDDYEEG